MEHVERLEDQEHRESNSMKSFYVHPKAWCCWVIIIQYGLIAPLSIGQVENDRVSSVDSNVVWVIPHAQSPFENLWATMDSLANRNEGSLQCLYVGGSHVQAGWIGHGLRKRFSNWVSKSDESRGLMLPYRMAETNTPTHFRSEIEGRWETNKCTSSRSLPPFGGTGIRVTTREDQAKWQHVAIRPDSSLFTCTEIEVWGRASGCSPKWNGTSTPAIRSILPDQRGWLFQFEEPVDTVAFCLEANGHGPIQFDLFGMLAKTPQPNGPKFTMHEWGHNGAKMEHVLRCEGLGESLGSMELDLILIGIGINDAHAGGLQWNPVDFESEYDSLIHTIRLTKPLAAIVLLTNTDSFRKRMNPDTNALKIRDVLLGLAKKHRLGVYDMGKAMGGLGSIQRWHELGWAQDDLIHFTEEGYDQLTQLIFNSWRKAYAENNHSALPFKRPQP